MARKTITVDAIQWEGDNLREIVEFAEGEVPVPGGRAAPALGAPGELMVPTMDGIVPAQTGDWIARGANGDLFVVRAALVEGL